MRAARGGGRAVSGMVPSLNVRRTSASQSSKLAKLCGAVKA